MDIFTVFIEVATLFSNSEFVMFVINNWLLLHKKTKVA